MTLIQQINARRDVIIFSRSFILLRLMMTFFIPLIIINLVVVYTFTGDKPWWSSPIQWLVFSLSRTSVTVVLALISPHVRNLWTKNRSRQHQTAFTPAIVRIDYRFLDNRFFSANLTRKVMFRSIDRLVIFHQLLYIKSVVQEERRLTFSAIFILII